MESGKRLHRILWSAVIFLAFIAVAAASRRIAQVVAILLHDYQQPPFRRVLPWRNLPGSDEIFAGHPLPTLIHVVPEVAFMVLGPLQFNTTLRALHLRWHRLIGKIFVANGFIIACSALIMSFAIPAIGGVNQAAATALFGTFMLFALCKAFWHIRRREIALHRQWMIRAFSIGLAVATVRLIVGFFFATSRFSGLTAHEFFGIAFWIGFVLHLIAAEAWIPSTSSSPLPAPTAFP
jgi:uncharacterized membrane protein